MKEQTNGLSRRLAELLAATTCADLPPHVIEDAQRSILDWLGSALAGAQETPARLVHGIVSHLGVSEDATVFAAGRSSAAAAAMANGVAAHILELDDIHKRSTVHAAAPVISAALAVAEREHSSGAAFLLAVVLGYEAALRIGEAVNPSHYRFWHPTGTVATFGAAAAAGSLMHLTAEQMLDALGTAGTQAAGLWEFNADGAMSKHLHPGKAAFNGILAADLARAGFTGATRILEGERGFLRAMSAAHDATRITEGWGERWRISENCYKLHSCCGHTHSAIDLAIALRQEDVASVSIETYGPGFEIVKEHNPRTPYQAKFSLAYCVAVALLEGEAGLEQFAPERFSPDGVTEPMIARLLEHTRVSVTDDLTAKYPEAWPARVHITLQDGSVRSGSSDYPRGNPENPVSTGELEEKFVALVGSRYSSGVAERGLEAIGALSTCTDMAETFRSLL